MHYIVLDFEWNYPLSDKDMVLEPFPFEAEIIQIGAIKLNENFAVEDEFSSFVSPTFYKRMNSSVVNLTKIRMQTIENAPSFSEAFAAFQHWCGEDCGLCSWGPDDIPVLMDNMIIHNIPTENMPCSYDLQRIFSREIINENRQCSLTDAVKLLQLPCDRAHDALNDARNTIRICERMDLAGCIEEYETYYVNYEQDRRNGLISGKYYPDMNVAMDDLEMTTAVCPYCGESVCLDFSVKKGSSRLGYGQCPEGDELFARLSFFRQRNSEYKVKRNVYLMSTDFWDIYQQAKGQ